MVGLISYPKVIFVQSAEPDDKTAGLLWVDTDDNSLNVANGTAYQSVSSTEYFDLWSDTDLNRSGSTGSQSKEWTAIAAADVSGMTYLDIDVLFDCVCAGKTATVPTGYNNIKIEAKEVGGSYGTLIDKRVNESVADYSTEDEEVSGSGGNMKYTHTLTAGEKTNGIQIKITTSTGGQNSSVCEMNVDQVSFRAYN